MKRMYKRRSQKGTPFNPSHVDLEQALMEFQNKGGEITKVQPKDADFNSFISQRDERAVDDFLMTRIDGGNYK